MHHHRSSTPLALSFAVLLLCAISLIPADRDASAPAVEPAAAAAQPAPHPAVGAWLAELPLDDHRQRLAVLVAVHAASWALDRAVIAVAERVEREALVEATAAAPAAGPRRGVRVTRPMTPFYSFATSASRAQES